VTFGADYVPFICPDTKSHSGYSVAKTKFEITILRNMFSFVTCYVLHSYRHTVLSFWKPPSGLTRKTGGPNYRQNLEELQRRKISHVWSRLGSDLA